MTVIDIISLNIFNYTLMLTLIFAVSVVSLRKIFWNVLDPLLLTLFYVSINVTNILYYYVFAEVKTGIVVYVLVSFAAFIAALSLENKKIILLKRRSNPNNAGPKYLTKNVTLLLLGVCILFTLVYMVFVLSRIGLGLITGEVDSNIKVTLTQAGGGIGIMKYISLAGSLLLIPLAAHAYVVYRMRALACFCFVLLLVSTFVANFSKSGLFFVLFDIGIILYFYRIQLQFSKKLFLRLVFFIVVSIVPAGMLLQIVSAERGMPILSILLERFIDTGGGSYQYFVLNGMRAFDAVSYSDKLLYYFDTILSVLRLKGWEEMSHVAYMSGYLSGAYHPGFGANPYIFMDGHFLMGWFGFLYSFIVGLLVMLVRRLKTDIVTFFVSVKLVMILVADPGFFQAGLISVIMILAFVALIYFAVHSQQRNMISSAHSVCSPSDNI